MFSRSKLFLLGIVLLAFFTTCKKKVIEHAAWISYDDISLPENSDVRAFSFPSIYVGYAAGKSMYKTVNAGASWQKLGITGNIGSIKFINENLGFCSVNGHILATSDGGQTWQDKMLGDYIDRCQNGTLVSFDFDGVFYYVSISRDTGKTFIPVDKLSSMNGRPRVTGNKAYVVDFNNSEYVDGFDLQDSARYITVYTNHYVQDIYSYNTDVAAGLKGYITGGYYGSQYDFYSLDGYADKIVAVGYHTIVTNIDLKTDDRWNDVFDPHGNGFDRYFYMIRFFDEHTFFVSGANGLLWRAKI